MRIEAPKKLITLALSSFFALVLLIVGAIYFEGRGAYGGTFLLNVPDVSVYHGEQAVISQEESLFLESSEYSLRLVNRESKELFFAFFAGDVFLKEVSVPGGEEREISLNHPGGVLSLALKGKKIRFGYVGEAKALNAVGDYLETDGDLLFSNETTLDGITLYAPFRLFGKFTVSQLNFDTERSGKIVLCPKTEQTGTLYVQAPACRVYFRSFLPNVSEDRYDFYIKAKSVNQRVLDSERFPVSNFDELSRLATEEVLPRCFDGASLRFMQSFEMESSVVLNHHVELCFQAYVRFDSYTLTCVSEKSGEYRVITSVGTAPSAEKLLFDSPKSSLTWSGEGSIPVSSTIEKYSNLSRYNEETLHLGGEGSARPILTLPAEQNDFLTEDAVFVPKGNTLSGVLPFLVSYEDLKEAKYLLECEGGSAYLEGTLSDGVIVTKDSNGNVRRFSLCILREKNSIPIVFLETENRGAIESKSQYVSATFSLDADGLDDSSVDETHIRIRGRGNSTWKWDKKPYKIHFDEPVSVGSMPMAEEWALFANYADKSLIRNGLAQIIAKELSFTYCPRQIYVDLFLNGEYIGIYALGEHLEEGIGRVEVKHDLNRVDSGYFLEAGGVVSGVDINGMNYFHAGLVKFVLIKGPDYTTMTAEQFDYIKKYMLATNSAVKKGEGYEKYLDMESLVDWMIMIELTNNTDCAWRRSTYFTKDAGEKLKMGPVWDFDLAFGNFSRDAQDFDVWVSTSDDDYVGETWSTYLLQDPKFQKLFRARWEEMRETLLKVAMNYIEEQYETLSSSAEYNFVRWDILGKKVAFERQDTKYYRTFESQMDYLRNFLTERADWITKQISEW